MLKIIMLTMFMFLATTMTHAANVNSSDEIRAYEYALYNLTVQVKNPCEAYPNQTININITAQASATLIINYTAIELYTFNESAAKDEKFDCIVYVDEENPVLLSGGESLTEACYNITIPEHASNVVYGKLVLLWMEKGTEESTTYRREPTFVVLYIRNPELERLRNKVPELERENAELKENITDINNTLTTLLNNLTDIKKRYEGELEGTKSVATILGVTTMFFAITTAYLFLRKPKEYW